MDPIEVPVLTHHKYDISTDKLDPVLSDTDADKKNSVEHVAVQALRNLDDFPDGGGRAWAVVLGVFCTFFSTTGYLFSWGVFQAYYQQTLLAQSSPSQIAWIGSVQARSLLFLPGVFVGRLFDVGFFRIPFAFGSIIIVVATFLIPLCTQLWHFLLCQGFMMGIGGGLTFGPAVTVVTHWWKKRRGLAVGIAVCGGSLGGTLFPIIIRQLLDKLDFVWTMRTLGFILILTFGVANICVARRLPPVKAAGGMFGLRVFRNPAFAAYSLSCLITPLGAFTVGTYISTSAIASGLSRNFALDLIAIQNGVGMLGSIMFGFMADRFGPLNVLVQIILCLGAVTIAWPFCSTTASISVIAVLYGILLGAFAALGTVAVAAMGGTEDLGRRLGTINTIFGLGGLIGPPLGGLLTSTSLGYKAVGYFAGGMICLGAFLFALARFFAVPKLWSKF
ncbi:major facilitator superfamily domain-containing protein [Mycena crocata]|nr:major facilitator superfamily domain-containing protein [Mycena crocata]